ncbi:hypothetical protein QCA50_004038 [Cerrena zonata]|uniref:Cytochrome P450 n=1 Tax=Cerrena zonata TaxID=2478898 RepID=A0AAW0GFS8_9APHY
MLMYTLPLALIGYLIFHYWEPEHIKTASIILLSELLAVVSVSNPLTLENALKNACIFLLTMGLATVAYRLSPFHPLARLPGPTLNKITQFRAMWTVWNSRQHLDRHEMHKKYGPIVRVGPNALSIVDVDAVNSVFGVNGLSKGRYYDARRIPDAPPGLLTMRGEPHAQRRRLWNRGLSTEAIRGYDTSLGKRLAQLTAQIESLSGNFDFTSLSVSFTFDVMGDVAFGHDLGMLEHGDTLGILKSIEAFNRSLALSSHVPWLAPVFQRLPMILPILHRMRDFAVRNATSRIQSGGSSRDIWHYLADEEGIEKEKPELQNVVSDAVLVIIAGYDTIATALAALFWFLLKNPECYKRLQQEIDTAYPDHADPLLTPVPPSKLAYLNACINETLRLHPPVPTSGPRQVPYTMHDKVVAGQFIPAGTQVYVPAYSLHRDPRYFPLSPDKFIPERWLGHKELDTAAFIPFSHGPANCVGRQLAKQELLVVTSTLLQRFTFSLANGYDSDNWPTQANDYLTVTRASLFVCATTRDG